MSLKRHAEDMVLAGSICILLLVLIQFRDVSRSKRRMFGEDTITACQTHADSHWRARLWLLVCILVLSLMTEGAAHDFRISLPTCAFWAVASAIAFFSPGASADKHQGGVLDTCYIGLAALWTISGFAQSGMHDAILVGPRQVVE